MRVAVKPLTCPRCSAEISFCDVSEATRTARCSACARVIDLTGGARVAAPLERPRPAAAAEPRSLARPRAVRPADVSVEEAAQTLRIEAPDTRGGLLGFAGDALAFVLARKPLLRISVTRGVLQVATWPLSLGRRSWQRGELQQLYVEERLAHQGSAGPVRNWALCARLQSNERVDLLANLGSVDLALFLEQSLERALGIRDVPVPGEQPRP